MLVRYSSMSGVVVYLSAVVTSIICNIVISAKTVDVIFSLSIYDYFAKDALSRHIC